MSEGFQAPLRRRRRRRGRRPGQSDGARIDQIGESRPPEAATSAGSAPSQPVPVREVSRAVERTGYVLALPDGRTIFREAERPAHALRQVPGGDATIPPELLLTRGLRPGDQVR